MPPHNNRSGFLTVLRSSQTGGGAPHMVHREMEVQTGVPF